MKDFPGDVNQTSTGNVQCRFQHGQSGMAEVAMAQDLKSFKKDWQRWSAAEKLTAVAILIVAAVALGGPVSILL